MMRTKKSRRPQARVTPIHALFAAAILALVAMPLAFAGAASGPGATASAVTDAKFKKLKKRVAALEGKLNGQAAGDLSGVYPNLQIRPAAVGTNELADNAVNTAKIADNAVTTAKIGPAAVDTTKLANSSVGAAVLKAISFRSSSGGGEDVVPTGDDGLASVGCVGAEEALAAMGTWDGATVPNLFLTALLPGAVGASVVGGNNTGGDKTLRATVACLTG